MRGVMIFAAGLFAGLAVHVAGAQRSDSGAQANNGVVMMNHVAVAVPNLAEAVTYYTQKMGYREAFRALDDKGQPRLVYLHISRNTFLELQPTNAQRPAGFNHYGLHVEDVAGGEAVHVHRPDQPGPLRGHRRRPAARRGRTDHLLDFRGATVADHAKPRLDENRQAVHRTSRHIPRRPDHERAAVRRLG